MEIHCFSDYAFKEMKLCHLKAISAKENLQAEKNASTAAKRSMKQADTQPKPCWANLNAKSAGA
jgi:hypothetical protein